MQTRYKIHSAQNTRAYKAIFTSLLIGNGAMEQYVENKSSLLARTESGSNDYVVDPVITSAHC